jgi:methenyltetrahydrofolate cyclohydrolase
MKYMDGKIKTYLKDLGSKTPAPGGGSAAALSSAMAASLLAMACGYTLGKEKYKGVSGRMKAISDKASEYKARLEKLVDLDVAAYRSKDFKKSIEVPAEVARLSYELTRMAQVVLVLGNKNLSTDAALAAALAATSFFAALSYVDINIRWAKMAPVPAGYKKLSGDLRRLRRRVLKIRKFAEADLGSYFRR